MAATVTLFAADSFDGTWKLNVTKSKFGSGPQWKSRTLLIESDGEVRKYRSESVNADGTTVSGLNESKYDGKDYPLPGSNGARTVALARINENTFETTFKRDGNVYEVNRSVVSADGKRMTTHRKALNARGEWYAAVYVFDKQ
jgi:hypothetical protein